MQQTGETLKRLFIKYGWLLIIAILFSCQLPADKIRIFMAGDSTMAIKETRAFPEMGWGVPFVHFFDSSVTVVNKARNGRSTRTFISEGIWKELIDDVQAGDYVFIQFGHNDESKTKAERYSSPEEYRNNLLKFINETEAKKAIPVLLTPVGRRRFDSTGTVMDSHPIYSDVVRQLAKDHKVFFIDADKKSQEIYQGFGAEGSKMLFLQLKPNEHPNYPDGRDDNTHFNELGVRLVAQMILKEMRSLQIPVVERVVKAVKKS
jgi:lysophospholipase L1-like esterase